MKHERRSLKLPMLLCLLPYGLFTSCTHSVEKKGDDSPKGNEVVTKNNVVESRVLKQPANKCFLEEFEKRSFRIEKTEFTNIVEVDRFFIDLLFEEAPDLYQRGMTHISGVLVSEAKDRKLPQVYVADITFEHKEQARTWFFHIIHSEKAYRILKQKSYNHLVLADCAVIVCRGFGNDTQEIHRFTDEVTKIIEECISCTGTGAVKMSEDTNGIDSLPPLLSGSPDECGR